MRLIRVCISPEEFALRRQPKFIRFMDNTFKSHQRKVESVEFSRDCVLEVRVKDYDGETELPPQMPTLLYNEEEADSLDASLDERRKIYRDKCKIILEVRRELGREFPLCEQIGVGYVYEDIYVVLMLFPGLKVCVSYEGSIYLLDDESMVFKTVRSVVRFARKHASWETPSKIFTSKEILSRSDGLRANIRHLSCAFPDLEVAPYSLVDDEIKVYVDLQWTCVMTLGSQGQFSISTCKSDPELDLCELRASKDDVARALEISAHFFSTGRVCANCSITSARKMRRCPCGGAYYCGSKCQKTHWPAHKPECTHR